MPWNVSSLLQSFIDSKNPVHGLKIHGAMLKKGFFPNAKIAVKLMILHLKSTCAAYARQVFDEMPSPTVASYNYMMSGYIREGMVTEPVQLVNHMITVSRKRPDGFTFSMLLKVSSAMNFSRALGRQVHTQILKNNSIVFDDVLSTALVNCYARTGDMAYARTLFDKMIEKDVVSSTSMISGYMQMGMVVEAEEMFNMTGEKKKDTVVFNAMIEGYSRSKETVRRSFETFISMLRLGLLPTVSTFASTIKACSLMAGLGVSMQVHAQVTKMTGGAPRNVKLGSAMVDMYSKCGRVGDARRVFDRMKVKNVVSWTSMIDGYGKNGEAIEAVKLFLEMEGVVEPNYVTFLSAMSACGHAGMVEKGGEIFDSMGSVYGMKPRMEHYACMVDILGRAGRMEEVWEMVRRMPEKPGADVWATVLSSCRLHGDVEMAKVVAREMLQSGLEDRSGAYVALSNTMAAAGEWRGVREVREVMKTRGVTKRVACSSVGVDGEEG